jgi:hypothetical protein
MEDRSDSTANSQPSTDLDKAREHVLKAVWALQRMGNHDTRLVHVLGLLIEAQNRLEEIP